ncbi:leucine-rich repeat-containing protein 43-like [Aulostomus maculatus]
MNSITLSGVLEKLIRHLCLNDFPCGHGSWRQTKDGIEGPDTEETDMLLDLLSCPRSPWRLDESWSPQAAALRQTAVLTPERLHPDFIYKYFRILHIVDKNVSVIDQGLLKFVKLEELILSANKISKVPAENLPRTLKMLELRANHLSELSSLTGHPPPHLHYLGLASNSLGYHDDVTHLTGEHWPQLVCLDLSNCEFQAQRTLLDALSTLPCLRTLLLDGNPFTLVSSYPGVTLDSLPLLSYLDASKISPEERQRFKGLAKMSDQILDRALASVSVGRMRGLPDPLTNMDESAPDFPVVTHRYYITYTFPGCHAPAYQEVDSESKGGAGDKDKLDSNKSCKGATSRPNTPGLMVTVEETCHNGSREFRHSTSKQTWSECINFSETQIHIISDLRGFMKFLHKGFDLHIEEEKVKSGSTKEKKRKSEHQLFQDTPISRILGSVHVPLQSLLKGPKVDVLCDFGKRKGRKENEDGSVSVQLGPQPVTVELKVELQKWKSASEATSFSQQMREPLF